jgi:hypothetical protein
VQVTATSSLADPKDPDHYTPVHAIDSDAVTPWCTAAGKGGVGDTLTLTFDRPIALSAMFIGTDGQSSGDAPRASVAQFDVAIDGKPSGSIKRDGASYPLKLDGKSAQKVAFTIAKVNESSTGYACIPDIAIYMKGDQYVRYTGDVAMLDAYIDTLGALRTAFDSCDAKKLADLVTFPIEASRHAGGNAANAKKLAQACKSKPARWRIGETLEKNLQRTRFTSATEGRATGDVDWTLTWASGHWHLTAVD